MTAPTSAPMDYAPPPRLHRLRRWSRLLLLPALVTLTTSAIWWGPPVGRHVTLLRLQRRCMTYAQPPGHAAYDTDRVRAAQLRNADPRYTALDSTSHATGYVLPEWQKLYG